VTENKAVILKRNTQRSQSWKGEL